MTAEYRQPGGYSDEMDGISEVMSSDKEGAGSEVRVERGASREGEEEEDVG